MKRTGGFRGTEKSSLVLASIELAATTGGQGLPRDLQSQLHVDGLGETVPTFSSSIYLTI